MLSMRSLKMRPIRGAAQACARARGYCAHIQTQFPSVHHSIDAHTASKVAVNSALVHLRRMKPRICATTRRQQARAQTGVASQARAAHLVHCRQLPMRVQRQDAHDAQRVHVAVCLHNRANGVRLNKRKEATSGAGHPPVLATDKSRGSACAMRTSTSSDSANGSSPSR